MPTNPGGPVSGASVRHASFRTNINLKVVPAVDGSGAALRQLTAREFADVSIREVWKAPAAVEIVPNDQAPLHLLPAREVLEAFHWRADFTLVYGRVLEDLT